MRRALALAAMLGVTPLRAEPDNVDGFVTANIVVTFYHEVGHALLSLRGVEVAGSEEDAADALSVLLIDRFHDEGAAQDAVRHVATAYALYDAQGPDQRWTYGDAHARDLVRYGDLVCLFYGADTGAREDLADELGLPDERRESCPEEYQAAADDWDRWLDGMPPQDHGPGLRLVVPPDRDALTATVAGQVRNLNREYGLPVPVDVTVERCGEANAFYDPRARRIVICTEYAGELARLRAADR
ncbi:MAG: DUF4344 domain-containing metallopeptidase [Gemmobacter sp.]